MELKDPSAPSTSRPALSSISITSISQSQSIKILHNTIFQFPYTEQQRTPHPQNLLSIAEDANASGAKVFFMTVAGSIPDEVIVFF
jgi:hypothetical protein